MTLSTIQFDSLLVALLATYNYSLRKAWELRDKLRRSGLCDPDFVLSQDVEQVGNLLRQAGYDRGGITYIIAPRVISLMGALKSGHFDTLPMLVEKQDKQKLVDLVVKVKGMGPRTADLVWELLKP